MNKDIRSHTMQDGGQTIRVVENHFSTEEAILRQAMARRDARLPLTNKQAQLVACNIAQVLEAVQKAREEVALARLEAKAAQDECFQLRIALMTEQGLHEKARKDWEEAIAAMDQEGVREAETVVAILKENGFSLTKEEDDQLDAAAAEGGDK